MNNARHFGISSSRQLHRHSPPVFRPLSSKILFAAIVLTCTATLAAAYYLANAGAF